jgi:hypothetical protein
MAEASKPGAKPRKDPIDDDKQKPAPVQPDDDFDPVVELREVSAAALLLAAKPDAFKEAYAAFTAQDAGRFQAVLDRLGIGDRCERICYFLCKKHCVSLCERFCPDHHAEPASVQEMIEFAQVLGRLVEDEKALRRLLEIFAKEDVGAWREWIKQNKYERYCHQLCHFLCDLRCKLVCRDLCPPKPLITRVGSIPISQISPSGLGNGPSIPPFHVGAPNPPAGYGDHPFGGSVWLMGIFNFPTATEYLVEVSSTGPGGSYSPVAVA